MNKHQFYMLLIFVLLSVSFLAMAWEFWIEDFLGTLLFNKFEAESSEERWEYVISIAIFVSLSMIYPFIVGKRLIEQQERLTSEIRSFSEVDHLTEMYNRRKITELFDREITRYKRYKYPLSIILIDIDYFKKVNDQFGHNQGDITLKEIASIIKTEARETDYVGRWGGEEFLIICPETDINGVRTLAEKLRNNISEYPFTRVGHKTASFVITTCGNDSSFENMLNHADKALYSAKSAGRNNVAQHI
jgi:polar amino acid transport system substrate-binding protein